MTADATGWPDRQTASTFLQLHSWGCPLSHSMVTWEVLCVQGLGEAALGVANDDQTESPLTWMALHH